MVIGPSAWGCLASKRGVLQLSTHLSRATRCDTNWVDVPAANMLITNANRYQCFWVRRAPNDCTPPDPSAVCFSDDRAPNRCLDWLLMAFDRAVLPELNSSSEETKRPGPVAEGCSSGEEE